MLDLEVDPEEVTQEAETKHELLSDAAIQEL